MSHNACMPSFSSRRQRALITPLAVVVVLLIVVGLIVGVTRWHSSGGSNVTTHLAPQDRPGPVILIPGYGGSQTSLDVLAARLRADGKSVTVLTLPGGGTGDLQAQADELAKAVAGQISSGAPSVDLVGYSAGGVVARLYVAEHGQLGYVRRVVSLGSPFHGTDLAEAAANLAPGLCQEACHQLEPGSALLKKIDSSSLSGTGVRWLSLWTSDDEVVMPPESARLAGAVNSSLQAVCADARVSHGQLPTDPLVVGLVLSSFGKGALPQPGPTYCDSLRARGR
jgi:triacylglycerol esterase/lipase EstA (alpha/beta hydrolase family)